MTQYSSRIGFYKLKCIRCGTEFDTIRFDLAKYCSYRCRNDTYIERRKEQLRNARIKKCLKCGIVFNAKRTDTIFCSAKCKQSHYREMLRLTVEENLPQLKNVTQQEVF
jgi:endogenous inhibitor of DNA gyrase (YacG/DUF329 family)